MDVSSYLRVVILLVLCYHWDPVQWLFLEENKMPAGNLEKKTDFAVN